MIGGRAESEEQRAESRERRAKSRKQKVESKVRSADLSEKSPPGFALCSLPFDFEKSRKQSAWASRTADDTAHPIFEGILKADRRCSR
jgi:hypothetical protein